MNKVITVLWKLFYVVFMLFAMLAFITYWILHFVLPHKVNRRFVYVVVTIWARVTLLSTGSRVEITGLENIPPERNLCLVGNHQSLFDIPAIMGWMGFPLGFIAKQELKKVPVIYHWMNELPCVFINRRNAREAMKSFQESAAVMKAGNPIVIFPEGTRAQSDNIAEFKAGSLKLPQMAGAVILPFAIKNTWRILEIDGNVHPIKVKLAILPPIYPTDPVYREKTGLPLYLQELITNKHREM